MATKLVKLVSDQASPFNVSNNIVDITLPSYLGACDLSQTCLVINLKLLDKSNNDALGLFDAGFKQKPNLDITSLIKNCKFSSQKGGIIEEIQAANVLHANVSPFQTDFESRKDEWYYGQAETQDSKVGTFLRKVDSGDQQSKQETAIKLPLSYLFGIGKMKQFSNKLFGDCKIHLEFEDDVSVVSHLFKNYTDDKVYSVVADNTPNTASNITTLKLEKQNIPNGNNIWNGMPITITGSGTSAAKSISSITSANPAVFTVADVTGIENGTKITVSGVAGSGGDINAVNTTHTVTAVDTGAKTITVAALDTTGYSFTSNGTLTFPENKTADAVIASSSYSQSSNEVTFTLKDNVNVTWISNNVSFQAKASGVGDTDLTYEINDVDLIAYQYLLSDSQISSLESKMKRGLNMEFLSYDLERVNMPAVVANTQYDRQFDCPPNTINVLMMTPLNGYLVSGADNASSFRWRLNGLETTNRDIVLGQSLYNDRIMSVLSSGSIKVRNLAPVSYIAGQSLPASPERQVVQIRQNQGSAASNAKILYLYKQRRRVIKANSNSVQVF